MIYIYIGLPAAERPGATGEPTRASRTREANIIIINNNNSDSNNNHHHNDSNDIINNNSNHNNNDDNTYIHIYIYIDRYIKSHKLSRYDAIYIYIYIYILNLRYDMTQGT